MDVSIIDIYMRNYFKLFKVKSGFTLIELLVVIGILGILAAAMVATIDPFEQLKKAQDTNTTNALVEYVNAITRYYTTHTAYPWAAAPDGANCNGGVVPVSASLSSVGMIACTTALIGDNELKNAFSSSTSLQYIDITQDVANNQTIACFNPASKSILHNTNTHFTSAGADDPVNCGTTALKDAHPLTCFWCTR